MRTAAAAVVESSMGVCCLRPSPADAVQSWREIIVMVQISVFFYYLFIIIDLIFSYFNICY